jgi:hypothetical protein
VISQAKKHERVSKQNLLTLVILLVGAVGFELTTPCTPFSYSGNPPNPNGSQSWV